MVVTCVEGAAIASNETCYEERAYGRVSLRYPKSCVDCVQHTSQVSKECNSPVSQHLQYAEATMQNSNRGIEERSRAKISSSKDNRDETEWKDDGANHANKSGGVGLIPF